MKFVNYNMQWNILSKAIWVFTILAMLFTIVIFCGEGTVLCFGKDGHVAIEFVDACNGAGPGQQLAGMESDACGPCKDIHFFNSPAYTKNTSHITQYFPMVSQSSISPALPLNENPLKQLLNLPASPHHKALASQHSVVLLI